MCVGAGCGLSWGGVRGVWVVGCGDGLRGVQECAGCVDAGKRTIMGVVGVKICGVIQVTVQ